VLPTIARLRRRAHPLGTNAEPSVTVAQVVYNARPMRRTFQSALSLLFVLVSIGGAYNVLSDNTDVERLAQEVACGDRTPRPTDTGQDAGAHPAPRARPPDPQECRAQKTRMERTPLAQTFDFATAKRQITVRCARSAILLGDYSCELR
jgi:hypothetical protein